MKEKILQMVDAYWKFDKQQQPISSWHDKQDLLKALEELLQPAVMQGSELFKKRCSNCGVDELFTKDDYCNCCGAKQVSFFK